jgi:hypothetical protein
LAARQNLVEAIEFNRHAQTLVSLTETESVTAEDIFLVLDLNEFYAAAQPKRITLSGLKSSLGALPLTNSTTYVDSAVYNVTDTDYYIGVNYSGVATVVMPPVVTPGRVIIVKDESGNAGSGVNRNIRISGSSQIDGEDEAIISYDDGSLTFIYRDGWRVI